MEGGVLVPGGGGWSAASSGGVVSVSGVVMSDDRACWLAAANTLYNIILVSNPAARQAPIA